MEHWVVELDQDLPVNLVGTKASVLGNLLGSGFPVPQGICLTTQAFRQAVQVSQEDLRLPEGLLDVLVQALPANVPLAVRSSAVLEDSPQASLAGRFTTLLNVNGLASLEQAVLDCWRSCLTAHEYCRDEGLAVLIQPLLNATCAGVCFTVDPVQLRPDLLLVASGWGMGAGVVSGSVPADSVRIRRSDLGVEAAVIAYKPFGMYPSMRGDGIDPAPIPDEQRSVPCLPEDWLQRVGQLGLAIEQVLGAPQDVEWAVCQDRLWVLQSRPVTAIPSEIIAAARFPLGWENAEARRHYWWLERGGKRPGKVLLPTEAAFIQITYQGGLEAVQFAGFAETRWIKFANGRCYMAKAASGLDPGRIRVNDRARRDLIERLQRENTTMWEYWGPEIVSATDRLSNFDFSTADGSVLADHLEDVLASGVRHWMIHTLMPRTIRSPVLLDAVVQMTGKPKAQAAADIPFLLAGVETVQTRLIETLYDLAYLAQEDPQTARAIVTGNQTITTDTAPAMVQFAHLYERFLKAYGCRICYRNVPDYPQNLPVPWREEPDYLWGLISAYLPGVKIGKHTHPRLARLAELNTAEARIELLCAACPDPERIAEFRWVLAYARRNGATLDEHNHYIDQLSEGHYYQAFLNAGRWLVRHGCLAKELDVYWLRSEEVLAALRSGSLELDEICTARKEEFDLWRKYIPPACLGLPLPELEAWNADTYAPPAQPLNAEIESNTLSGETASRGKAEGRARIYKGDLALPDIAPGEVLVVGDSNLVWTPILPTLAALILDNGSPGDHTAITAREFGIPSVCATRYATRTIPEGAWIIVDADAGRLTWTAGEV